MKKLLPTIFIQIFILSCTPVSKPVLPQLYEDNFPGFNFSNKLVDSTELTGYEYQTVDNETVDISNCEMAKKFNLSKISDFEYHRFKLLLISCEAVNKYSNVKSSKVSNFPENIVTELISELPAAVIPLLSKKDMQVRADKTLATYDKKTQFISEGTNTNKVLTAEDEIYISVLARGDFTNDGIEDLLLKTEWYARNAHGKHADLLVVSRPFKTKPMEISWRLNKMISN